MMRPANLIGSGFFTLLALTLFNPSFVQTLLLGFGTGVVAALWEDVLNVDEYDRKISGKK